MGISILNNGGDMLNEHIIFNYESESDEIIQFNWKISDAGNNWYWAIDNIIIQMNTPAIGDLNDDGIINILDVILIVNIIIYESPLDEITAHISDINNDSNIDILDVILIVNYILDR